MQCLVLEKSLQLAIKLCLICFMLTTANGYASAAANDRSGIRIVGHATDGSIALDGSNSSLTNWEIPSVIKRTNTQHLSAPELVAIGMIDSLDPSNNTVTVAGQIAAIGESTQLVDALNGNFQPLASVSNAKPALIVGRHVAIAGDIIGPGQSIARLVVLIPTAAAPGTSLIYIRGVVEGPDLITKEVVVGKLKLNLNLAGQSNEHDDLLLGNVIEAIGYYGGPGQLTVTGFSNLTAPEPASSSGTALQGIHGSGLKGIHGSGLKGIHGSGLKGIHGSGLKGIHGSGLKGIHGSGLKGIHGSGLKGIHGSGLKGIHGSGLKGIHGSGLKAAPLQPMATDR